jgi:hypothetical protein
MIATIVVRDCAELFVGGDAGGADSPAVSAGTAEGATAASGPSSVLFSPIVRTVANQTLRENRYGACRGNRMVKRGVGARCSSTVPSSCLTSIDTSCRPRVVGLSSLM